MLKAASMTVVAVAAFTLLPLAAHATACSPWDVASGASACSGSFKNGSTYTGEVTFSNFDDEFGGSWSNAFGSSGKGGSTLQAGSSDQNYSVGTGNNVSFTIFDVMPGYDYGFSIKAGQFASLYFFDWETIKNDAGYIATGVFEFTASTTGTSINRNGIGQGISNSGLFTREAISVVPLPAAGWMLVAGIGALAALARRRKS